MSLSTLEQMQVIFITDTKQSEPADALGLDKLLRFGAGRYAESTSMPPCCTRVLEEPS